MVLNIQKQMQELFGQSCYCYCIAKYFSGIKDIKGLTMLVLQGWVQGYICDDGFVSKPLQYVTLIKGAKYRDVEKPKINSLSDLPDGEWIVEYSYNKGSHFVIADKNGVTFDPAGESNSVKFGQPISYRRFVK